MGASAQCTTIMAPAGGTVKRQFIVTQCGWEHAYAWFLLASVALYFCRKRGTDSEHKFGGCLEFGRRDNAVVYLVVRDALHLGEGGEASQVEE